MSPLSRREQAIMREWGGWLLQWTLIDPASGVAQAKSQSEGRSHFVVDGERFRLSTTARGLELSLPGVPGTVEALTWSKVTDHARSIPQGLRDRLADHRRRYQQSQSDYPMFGASAEAVGCGPLPAMGPVTARQAKYQEEYAAHVRDRLEPWQAERRLLDDERVALLDEAFPDLAEGAEPTDLLDLLATLT